MTTKVWDIPGGIHPPECKERSTGTAIQPGPLSRRLILPLTQHIGAAAEPCVEVGERVRKGQLIARAGTGVSAALHAPTSGTVSLIGAQPFPHVSGLTADAIVIDSDGRDEWVELQPHGDYREMAPAALLELIAGAGISGLGGAGFPTSVKLAAGSTQQLRTLIINGAECEPYITADDLLMREKAAELVIGIEILVRLLEPEEVLIGIEDNKPEAVAAVRAAVGERSFGVRVFPTKYPSGGERQLIQILTGVEVPSGRLPVDIGVLCQNVGTCVAIHDAVILGRPMISRVTTLTGDALARPMNVEAILGTPVGELLAFAGLDSRRLGRLVMGGPMMGFTLPSLEVPLIKTSNCLLAGTAAELPAPPPALPCIRCGACAEVCPASLLPQQLHFFALGQEHEQLEAHHLFDCIECGACAYVCPSSIPLVQYYRAAKGEIRELEHRQQKAEYSRQRFELRQERLRRAEERKEAERKARAERVARARTTPVADRVGDDPLARLQAQKVGAQSDRQKKLKIEASMARVALRKAEKQLAVHATPELAAQVEEMRATVQAAQQALASAEDAAPAPPSTEPAADDAALNKARIEAAMLRARLRKAEQAEVPEQVELEALRKQLVAVEKNLLELQGAAPARAGKGSGDDSLKKAKIHLALKRAELKKAEAAGLGDAELEPLRRALEAAEQALHGAEETSGKPPPALQRVDKRPVTEAERRIKTELAFARADLRKLEREGRIADEALEAARQRVEQAERALREPHR